MALETGLKLLLLHESSAYRMNLWCSGVFHASDLQLDILCFSVTAVLSEMYTTGDEES